MSVRRQRCWPRQLPLRIYTTHLHVAQRNACWAGCTQNFHHSRPAPAGSRGSCTGPSTAASMASHGHSPTPNNAPNGARGGAHLSPAPFAHGAQTHRKNLTSALCQICCPNNLWSGVTQLHAQHSSRSHGLSDRRALPRLTVPWQANPLPSPPLAKSRHWSASAPPLRCPALRAWRQTPGIRDGGFRCLALWRLRPIRKRPAVAGDDIVAAKHDHSGRWDDIARVGGGVEGLPRRHRLHLGFGPVACVLAVEQPATSLAVPPPCCGALRDRAPPAHG